MKGSEVQAAQLNPNLRQSWAFQAWQTTFSHVCGYIVEKLIGPCSMFGIILSVVLSQNIPLWDAVTSRDTCQACRVAGHAPDPIYWIWARALGSETVSKTEKDLAMNSDKRISKVSPLIWTKRNVKPKKKTLVEIVLLDYSPADLFSESGSESFVSLLPCLQPPNPFLSPGIQPAIRQKTHSKYN